MKAPGFSIINNLGHVSLSDQAVTSFTFTLTFRTLTANLNVGGLICFIGAKKSTLFV